MQPGNPGTASEKKGGIALIAVVVIAGVVVMCVAFIGILAAIAIPSFVGYTRRAKTSEARMNLSTLARAEASYYESVAGLVTSAGPMPAAPGPTKQLPAFASDPGFSALGFAPPDPVYYSYSILPDPSTPGGAILCATGDLDGDGSLSRFELRCRPDGSCESSPLITSETE